MPDPKPAKTAKIGPLRLILVAVGVVLVLAAALAWLNRRTLARDALTGWLKSKGVAADAEVEAFGPTTFTARLTLGDPKNPDFAAEQAVVRYRPRLTGIEVVSVSLRKPVLRARLRASGLSVGSLDPLIREFLRRPPRPDAAKPRISIDDGLLLLATDYGALRIAADAVVDDGQLQSLAATSAPARLRGPDFDVSLGAASLRQSATANRFDVSLTAPVTTAAVAGRTLSDGRLTLSAQGPYPDLVKRRGEGPVAIRAALAGRRLAGADQDLEAVTLSAGFDGRTAGWIQDLLVTGRATADLAADAVTSGAARSGAVRASLVSDDVRWARRGGDRVTASIRANGEAAGIAAADLSLDRLAVNGRAAVDATPQALRVSAQAALDGRGGWRGLDAPTPTDTAQVVAIKRAARRFRLSAPAIGARAELRPSGAANVAATLERPLTLRPDTGGEVRVTAGERGPIRITSAGGGLPHVDARLSGLGGGGADLALTADRLAAGPLVGGHVEAAGRLRFGEAITFTTARCVSFRGERLEFGANDVEALAGRFCPAGGPLLRMQGGRWSVNGRAEGVAAAVPFLQARVDAGAAQVTAQGRGGAMSVRAQVTTARLSDTAPEARFNPLTVSGPVTLADFIWRADLGFRIPAGAPIGTARVTHDGRLAIGVVVLETPMLPFAEGGLQPADISPLAAAVGAPATGSAQFEGRFDWAPEGAASSGVLSIPRLDFTSPVGPVKGLSGEIALESLAPLIAAPGQELTVETIEAIVPVTGLKARFSLKDERLVIAGGEAAVGGGQVRVETLEIPLTPGAPTRGVLIFDGVQLHDLVEASPFGDKVELDARVSGRVPFEMLDNRVRITGGELRAIQPGRISIDRTALTGVQADTAVEAPIAEAVDDPNATFTDFAYQAMENLAFDKLEASIASREDGRMGVLFHIVGEHDPPTTQRIRLTLMDLIQRRFLGRKLPLPSGTKVNLTLDTTLNLDDLLNDWADYQRARNGGSGGVQP